MEYRNQPRIVADILLAVRDLDEGGGVGITLLLRKCNLSYARIKPLISTLTGAGLLLEEKEGRQQFPKYLISDDGIIFLRAWFRFDDFAQSFGLKL